MSRVDCQVLRTRAVAQGCTGCLRAETCQGTSQTQAVVRQWAMLYLWSVKRLAEQDWVTIDQKTGIHYQPSVANQDKLLMLNEWEPVSLGRLIERLKDN